MSDEEDLYDEFGNYIGPDLNSSDDDDDDDDEATGGGDVPRQAGLDDDDDDDASDVSVDDNNKTAAGGRSSSAATAMVIHDDDNNGHISIGTTDPASAIVLHEDKEHYLSAEQVYGDNVRTAVLDEDAMDIETPLVEPLSTKSHYYQQNQTIIQPNDWLYNDEYLSVQLSNETTRTRRGIAIIGHLHHGKTCLVDLLLETALRKGSWGDAASLDVSSSTSSSSTSSGPPRYTDTLQSERERQLSLVSTPITTLLPDTRGKAYCITIMDCPGHPNFHDETVAALRAVDGAVVVVDAVEGIMLHTEMVVRHAVTEGLPITLVISKVDRCIVELKLPPRDCYYKLLSVVESMNELIQQSSHGRYPKLSPNRGNVAFASSQHGWIFTLESFAQVYLEHVDNLGDNMSVTDFSQRLWGDAYLDPVSRTFHTSSRDCPTTRNVERTFVTYVLGPLYKIYTACLGEHESNVNKLLRSVGVLLNKDQLRASARPLLRSALSKFLQTSRHGFVDMIVQHIPCPMVAAKGKIARGYTGPMDSKIAKSMLECDARGPLVIHAVKLYAAADGQSFLTFGRIYSGTIRPGTQVRVLGEAYSPQNDNEDAAFATVEAIYIPRGQMRTEVTMAKAGNWILLQGLDNSIAKTATITSANKSSEMGFVEGQGHDNELHIFAPLKFPQAGGESVMKLAIEPLNPAELPKMVEGLRRVSKAYPMIKTKVEESGEHILLGTGELYMDCVMHDLRHVYSDIEVKVADPIVSFRETVIDTSSIKCFSETANKRNKLTFMAEPLDEGLAEKLEAGKINPDWDQKKLGRFFQTQYNWDLLSSRSVWAFGDSPTHGTNILMDDTLPSEVDKGLLNSCRSSIVQGFKWATREGPLCEEPVRGTKIKILDVTLADKPIYRGGGQVIPTARRTVHSSLLTATPRLMEPIYRLQIQCPKAIVDAIQPVLTRRRGHIVQDRPIPGTTFYSVRGYLPALDSFGFETDLRTFTQGQAMVFSTFDHWSVVPGDPLDRSIILHPLEPSPPQYLSRELLIKTRRRKGLTDDVTVSKFFDEGMKALLEGDGETRIMQ